MIKLTDILGEWKVKRQFRKTSTTYCVAMVEYEDYSNLVGVYTSRMAAEKGVLAHIYELMYENEDIDLSLEQFLDKYSYNDVENDTIGYGYEYEIYENVDLISYA